MVNIKAPARPCRQCGGEIPAQSSGPGRPRLFCSRRCRRKYHQALEQADVERRTAEERERLRFEYLAGFYGVRRAKRLAGVRRFDDAGA